MSTRRPSGPRGVALLATVVMVAVILGLVAGLMYYASQERYRAINTARTSTRLSCAQAGLQLAKGFFGANFTQWSSTYLAQPTKYNPVRTPNNANPADPYASGLRSSNPELFVDLDNDGQVDAYIYVRDNQDELNPAVNDFARDNDQNVIVGAVCVSNTLVPRTVTGAANTEDLVAESVLSYNIGRGSCAQRGCGTGGNNYN